MRRIKISKKTFLILTLIFLIGFLISLTIDTVEIEIYEMKNRNASISANICISKINNLETPMTISTYLPSWENLHKASWSRSIYDGFWFPKDCISKQSLAIIIPYRNRENHLIKLLSHLHPFLQKQMVQYQMFVIEQSPNGIFNKGALINVGIKEAMSTKKNRFSCFIIHDVDMLPLMESNIYQCLDNPLHLGSAVDKYNYNLIYRDIVGGVLALTPEHLFKVNGFSNIYEGWGAEDDDMAERIRLEKLKIIRYPINMGKYNMIKHKEDKGNPSNEERVYYLKRAKYRYKVDGLNNIFYTKLKEKTQKTNLAHWVLVEIPPKYFFMKPDF